MGLTQSADSSVGYDAQFQERQATEVVDHQQHRGACGETRPPRETLQAPRPEEEERLGYRVIPSPACTGTRDTLEESVMWSSMSVTISSALAICQSETQQ